MLDAEQPVRSNYLCYKTVGWRVGDLSSCQKWENAANRPGLDGVPGGLAACDYFASVKCARRFSCQHCSLLSVQKGFSLP